MESSWFVLPQDALIQYLLKTGMRFVANINAALHGRTDHKNRLR